MSIEVSNNKYGWLVDTGASISVIKYDLLAYLQIPFHKKKVVIKGIGGNVFTEGYGCIKLCYNDCYFVHKFYVLKQIPSNTDGILGQDFLKTFNAILNFEHNTLSLTTRFGKKVSIPLDIQPEKYNYLTIPARSESIHFIDTYDRDEFVIECQELCEGVFVASTIVKPENGKLPIKILNTRESDVNLNNISLNKSKLSDYYICQFSKPTMNADRVKLLFSQLKLDTLNEEERKSIENICAKFPDIFHLPGDKLNITSLYEHNIELEPHSTPLYSKPYRLPQTQRLEVDKQIQEMLTDGIIEESTSAWSSPLLLVPKKTDLTGNKKWRVVIDYRKLNNKIKDDKFPLPNITDILDSLSGSVYFSHLDLFHGFYQIGLHPTVDRTQRLHIKNNIK